MIKKILSWHKKFWDYIFDEGGCRTTQVLKKSITGIPLLTTGKGYLYKQTREGIFGATVLVEINQFGSSVDVIKDLILGNYDYCLDKAAKEAALTKIRSRVSKGGEYLTTERNSQGNLDFKTAYWSSEDLGDIERLLEKYYG